MKKMKYIVITALVLCFAVTGCGSNEVPPIQNTLDKIEESNYPQVGAQDITQAPVVQESTNNVGSSVKISAEEAKGIMESESDFIILDVRNKDEYDEGHIKNAVLLPVDNIEREAGPVIGGKDKTILVYCRSGNRSGMAAAKLVSLGYTDVRDFGGINNWPYEIVKD